MHTLPLIHDDSAQAAPAGAHLRQWHEATSRTRPALVFAPGFLTESGAHPKASLDGWKSQCVELARLWNWAAYGLHWPSATLAEVLTGTSPRVSPVARAMNLYTHFFLSSGTLSWLGARAGIAISTWRSAAREADRVAQLAVQWPQQLGRPVALVGHSLGARLALRAAEAAPAHTFEHVIGLAPAVLASKVEWPRVARASRRRPIMFSSQNDAVLKLFFRAAEASREPAVGQAGLHASLHPLVESRDVSTFGSTVIKHGTYRRVLVDLLRDHGGPA